jgi:hypothetical protein
MIHNTLPIGAIFLLGGISQRQKLSKPERALEEVGVKAAGLHIQWIPRIIVLLVLLLITFILLKLKILTWFLLVGLNLAFLAYWIHVMRRTRSENEIENETGYQNADDRSVITTKSTKMIYA